MKSMKDAKTFAQALDGGGGVLLEPHGQRTLWILGSRYVADLAARQADMVLSSSLVQVCLTY